jgi:hypothetical protein
MAIRSSPLHPFADYFLKKPCNFKEDMACHAENGGQVRMMVMANR